MADLLLARLSVVFAVCYLAEVARRERRLLARPLDELAELLARYRADLEHLHIDTLDLWIGYTLLSRRERTANRREACGWLAQQLQRLLWADREERRGKTGAVKLWSILAGLYENRPQGVMYRGALRMLTRRAPFTVLGPDGAHLQGEEAPRVVLPADPQAPLQLSGLPPDAWERVAARYGALRREPPPAALALDPRLGSLTLFQLLEALQQQRTPPAGGWEALELRASCPECRAELQVERLRLPGSDRLRLPPHSPLAPERCGQSCPGGALTLTLMPDLSNATNHALEGRPC